MTDESIQQQMDELIHLLERYNREYYELDEPSVSDAEYDVAFRHLQQLETQHPHLMRPVSPTQRVGGKALSQFDSVVHQVPMLSLNNAFSPVNVDGVYDHSEMQAFTEPTHQPKACNSLCSYTQSTFTGAKALFRITLCT